MITTMLILVAAALVPLGPVGASGDDETPPPAGNSPGTGTPLEEGTTRGHLGPGNVRDAYTLTAARDETLTVHVDPEPGIDVRAGFHTGDPDDPLPSWRRTLTFTADAPMHLGFRISLFYEHGTEPPSGNYTLTLSRSGGDGAYPPPLPEPERVPGVDAATAIKPHPDGGVYAIVDDGLAHVTTEGVTRLSDVDVRSDFAVDEDGGFIAGERNEKRLVHVQDEEPVPFLRTGRSVVPVAFGPDAHLYAVVGRDLQRLDAHATLTQVVELPHWIRSMAFAPDGALYAIVGDGQDFISTVDPDSGEVRHLTRQPVSIGERTFAMDAEGRVYVGGNWFDEVYRYDPATDAWRIVARGVDHVHDLGFGTDRLFMDATLVDGTRGVFTLDVDASGFPGYTGPFQAPPVPDLVIGDVRESPREEIVRTPLTTVYDEEDSRDVLVDVLNAGEGPWSGTLRVRVDRMEAGYRYLVGEVEATGALAPGESLTVPVEWDTSGLWGTQYLRVHVESLDAVEGDRSNNVAYHETGVHTDCAGAAVGLIHVYTSAPCARRAVDALGVLD